MKLIDLIFCDDIRCELGFKYTLCGVYQHNIFIPENVHWPVRLQKFCILAKVECSETAPATGTLLVQRDGEEAKPISSFDFTGKKLESVFIPFVFPVFSVAKPGPLSFILDIECNGKKEKLVCKNCIEFKKAEPVA